MSCTVKSINFNSYLKIDNKMIVIHMILYIPAVAEEDDDIFLPTKID